MAIPFIPTEVMDFEEGSTADADATTGSPTAATAAALNGIYGCSINAANEIVQHNLASTATKLSCYLRFDPNSFTSVASMALVQAIDGAAAVVARFVISYSTGVYSVRAQSALDTGGFSTATDFTISDAPHELLFVWIAATSAGANNGAISLYVDGVHKESVSGLDNDTFSIASIRYGARQAAGLSDTFYIDDCAYLNTAWPFEWFMAASPDDFSFIADEAESFANAASPDDFSMTANADSFAMSASPDDWHDVVVATTEDV